MKKLGLILLMSVAFFATSFAQNDLDSNPKVMEKRKAFYNKELQFTDAEANAFWPVYMKYQKEQKALRKQYRANAKVELMTDAEAEAHVKKSLEYKQKETDLMAKYFDKFSAVLPVRKVAMLTATERKFKRLILNEIKKKRKGRRK